MNGVYKELGGWEGQGEREAKGGLHLPLGHRQ